MTNIDLVIGKKKTRKTKLKWEREVQKVMNQKHLITKDSVTPEYGKK
jgi:hypothetical protein